MTDNTPAWAAMQEAVLTDDEILRRWDIYVSEPSATYPLTNADKIAFARAIESALLSKLRAPKPLGDSCHHCGWTDWLSQDGAAYCQACGKPHGSVPAEGLPNLPQLLRENADLDEAEGGNPQVCTLERDAADEIERLRREVAKLRAPVADERVAAKCGGQLVNSRLGNPGDRVPCPVCAKHITLRRPFNGCITGWVQVPRHNRAALASAPVAGEAQPTDEQILDIADRVWREQEQDPTDKSAVLALVREVLGQAPVADERVSDDTLWSWAEQVMGGKEAHHVGRDRVLRYAHMLLLSAPVVGE